MVWARLLPSWLVVLFVTTTAPAALAQPLALSEFAEATSDNVVRIESRWANGAQQSGFGYIVGTAERRMTVATASHVIAAMVNGEFQAAQEIVIISRDGVRHVGENADFGKNPNGIDLGFIDFMTEGPILFTPVVVALTPPAAGEEVWLHGAKDKVRLNPTSGRVSATTETHIRVAALGGVPGLSGAPVLSSHGVIGLYLSSDPIANVLQIGVIKLQAASYGRTWMLEATRGGLPTIEVQFVRADSLDVPVNTVGPAGASGLKIPGIYQLAPGSYGLNFDIKRVKCIPLNFVVAVTNSNQRIEVFCSPKLDGKWSSEDVDAMVMGLGNGDYELTTVAKNNLPSNSLIGRMFATNTANQYQTKLTDLLKRDRSGSMVVSPDLLEMKITIPLGAFDSRTLTLRRQ